MNHAMQPLIGEGDTSLRCVRTHNVWGITMSDIFFVGKAMPFAIIGHFRPVSIEFEDIGDLHTPSF